MALTAGTCLGHYDVTSLIGEGGMGQVWQATVKSIHETVASTSTAASMSGTPRTRVSRKPTPLNRPPPSGRLETL